MQPLVSCVMPTYNRCPAHQHLVEEAVESFFRQDYENRQLVILNDAPGQELKIDSPYYPWVWGSRSGWTHQIPIINSPFRYASLGEKYNAAIEMAGGDLIMPWEDDDISLPWRITQAVEKLGDLDYWKPPQVVYLPNGSPPFYKHAVGVRHHAGIFRRSAWEKVGGYPPCSGAQDSIFDTALFTKCRHAIPPATAEPGRLLPLEEWAYIYRWGVSDCHLSGVAPHDDFYRRVGEQPVERGTFTLRPHWREDYVALTRAAIAGSRAGS